MSRVYNFCAGPAALPERVLAQAQADLLDWQGHGLSVMEMSHRGEHFQHIAHESEQDLRALLNIPEHYKVLFLQGGASSQFAMVPLNLLGNKTQASYINTGQWSKKAISEAKRFAQVEIAASSEAQDYVSVPASHELSISKDSAYLHYTPNETIGGLSFDYIPDITIPLVADYSSAILSQPLDIERFGLIYAGAQKNIGPAGLCLVIVREDLLGSAQAQTPAMLNYQTLADAGSMYNTPPTFSWYLAGLVFKWLKDEIGGLANMAVINQRKADKLYTYLDGQDFYANPINPAHRSMMNVPFTLAEPALEQTFLQDAKQAGLLNLAGHRSVGGMRASIYNAVPEAAIDALLEFMQDFVRQKG